MLRRRPTRSANDLITSKKRRPLSEPPRTNYAAEPLEDRMLLVGNLHINEVYLTTANGTPITSVAAGDVVYMQAEFTTTGLAPSASYDIDMKIHNEHRIV